MLVREGELFLPGAKKEVKDIVEIIPGQLFIGNQASERNFIERAGDFRIIHLSAHALLNNELPSLSKFLLASDADQMYDNHLTASEICHLDLSAELAVLSACHTGSGKVNRGEGVMSLSRAFAFAGVPATLSSLWKVPDHTTAQLMSYFYKGIRKRMDKHEALNYARVLYLNDTEIADHRHPYFWAGFILYGDTGVVDLKSDHFFLICTLVLFLFTLIFYFRKKVFM
jgi:CHAT domain-containing protein